MAPPAALLGPPVAGRPRRHQDGGRPQVQAEAPGVPRLQQLQCRRRLYREESKAPPPSARAIAYTSSSGVDFFFQVAPGAPAAVDVASFLSVALGKDARTALRLVCHLRGFRGWASPTGTASTPPRSGCTPTTSAPSPTTSPSLPGSAASRTSTRSSTASSTAPVTTPSPVSRPSRGRGGRNGSNSKRRCIEGTAQAKRQKEAEHAQVTNSLYDWDKNFRLLYDDVAELFAELLKSDLEHLRAGDTPKIDRLHREVLVLLRKVLELPEVYMSAHKLDELPYARVQSLALRQYKEAFQKHDKSGVVGFLDEVRACMAKILADALLPNEIVAAALKGEHDESAELKWRHMVESGVRGPLEYMVILELEYMVILRL